MNLIQHHIPLNNKNWFQTGGPARFYCEPQTNQEFQNALLFANRNQIPVFILGEGANILIDDNGFDGLVIHPKLKHISVTHLKNNKALLTARAGLSLNEVIEYCLAHQLIGLEEFSGIPGTVGGSIFINLHYYEFLLEHFLASAQVIERTTGNIIDVTPAWFNFGYNQSTLHSKEYYLLKATFTLTKATVPQTAYAQGRRTEIIRHRTARYPQSHTCGSFFRNFHPNEVSLTSNGKKIIWIAYYLDKIGVKGQLTYGNAIVSYKHANMLVNRGAATTNDIVHLARTMQEQVFKTFGIMPQPECQLVGFKNYPLLK